MNLQILKSLTILSAVLISAHMLGYNLFRAIYHLFARIVVPLWDFLDCVCKVRVFGKVIENDGDVAVLEVNNGMVKTILREDCNQTTEEFLTMLSVGQLVPGKLGFRRRTEGRDSSIVSMS
jgi:hypothetical protein